MYKKYGELTTDIFQFTRDYYGERLVSFVLFRSVARDIFRFASDIDFPIIATSLP